MDGHAFTPHIFFGLDPMAVSTVILVVTYAVIIWDQLNRAIVALLGASAMVVIGALDQAEALKGIDWNTIGLLTGMMILVSISRRSGMFQALAIWAAQKAKANPAGILLLLQLTTAVVSALLDNVTTVLLVVPVTLAITRELDVPPYPFLFAEIFASNIGGTATLIRRPALPILIGSLTGLDFNAFVIHLTPVIIVVMAAQALMIHLLLWGRALHTTPARAPCVMGMSAERPSTGTLLLKQSLAVLTGVVIVAFIVARPLHLEPATIALAGAAVLMLLDNWRHHTEKVSRRTSTRPSATSTGSRSSFRRPVRGGARGRSRRRAAAARRRLVAATGGGMAGRLRSSLGVGDPLGDRRQHPVRRHHDPADQEHGAGLWRGRQDRAAMVVPLARRLPRRQRHLDRGLRQPDRRRARRNATTSRSVSSPYSLYAFPMMLVSVTICHSDVWWRYF